MAPPAPPEQETEGIKKQTCETGSREGNLLGTPQCFVSTDWPVNESDGRLNQSSMSSALAPVPPPSTCSNPEAQPGERAFPSRESGGAATWAFSGARWVPPNLWDTEGRADMSDSAGELTRLRCYSKLPVWVVEDHQEVSGRLNGPGSESLRAPTSRISNPGALTPRPLALHWIGAVLHQSPASLSQPCLLAV